MSVSTSLRSLGGRTARVLNAGLARFGLRVSRAGDGHSWSDAATYIPFELTIEAARQAGMSVGDYIDTEMNGIPGATTETMEWLRGLGVFDGPLDTVLEIGPGSGRYLERTIELARPRRYEVYETARPWAQYLASTYDIVLQTTDGRSLAATPDESVDLAQAHKVFNSIPFVATCRYWPELVRVTRPGGFVVFDVLTEACFDDTTVDSIVASGIDNSGAYPTAVPAAVVSAYFDAHGFDLVGTFLAPMSFGATQLHVFKKRAPTT